MAKFKKMLSPVDHREFDNLGDYIDALKNFRAEVKALDDPDIEFLGKGDIDFAVTFETDNEELARRHGFMTEDEMTAAAEADEANASGNSDD